MPIILRYGWEYSRGNKRPFGIVSINHGLVNDLSVFGLGLFILLFGLVAERLDNVSVQMFVLVDEFSKPLPTKFQIVSFVWVVILAITTGVYGA